MSTPAVVESTEPESGHADGRYPAGRLVMGVLGRTWLWFLAGCLLITLVPIAFGWRPYVVESDSMAPRIRAGDVVLSSPISEFVARDLVGHVIVFDDPNIPGRVVTHRVASADGDQLRTKGDANPQVDSQPIGEDRVRGLGRLLVRFVGLPFIWIHRGQWFWLLIFLVSMIIAAWATNRDQEPDEQDPPTPPDPPAGIPESDPVTPAGTWQVAAVKPPEVPRSGLRIAVKPLMFRLAALLTMSLLLLLPATAAAFSATTKSAGNSWAVPVYDYPTEIMAISPKPYLYWKFDETTTGNSAADSSGNGRSGTYQSNGGATYFTRLTDGALDHSTPDRAITLANDASCVTTSSGTLINGQTPATVIIWFKAPSTMTNGGKLAGFEKPQTGVAVPSTGTYDRHLYMDGQGRVWFGVYNNAMITVGSQSTGLNDNNWHMAVGSVGPGGTKLYIDGVLQGTNANTQGENTNGLWRVGCGNLAGWGGSWGGNNTPGTSTSVTANRVFRGSLDEFTVFEAQLTDSQVSFLYFTR